MCGLKLLVSRVLPVYSSKNDNTEGTTRFLRIHSYISTSAKNEQNILDAMMRSLKGDPFIPTPRVAKPSSALLKAKSA